MITALALAAAVHAPVQTPDLVPCTRYDPDIPTLEQVAGHDFGEASTPPAFRTAISWPISSSQ